MTDQGTMRQAELTEDWIEAVEIYGRLTTRGGGLAADWLLPALCAAAREGVAGREKRTSFKETVLKWLRDFDPCGFETPTFDPATGLESSPTASRQETRPLSSEGGEPKPGDMLNNALLDLVRLCERDGVGNLDLTMEGVVADGKDAGDWHLTLSKREVGDV